MTLDLSAEMEAALKERARRLGVTPEDLALDILREQLAAPVQFVQARDEWERLVLGLGTNCGVSLSNEALSSEGLYA
ncbi:MAG TPA: hypothetical protein VMS17_01055 [Gemmataceae bacterium]|nr:hypothetical protein [Gemmataceae bacterium]